VIGGWRSPHFTAARLARRLARATSGKPGDVVPASYALLGTTPAAMRAVRQTILTQRWHDQELDIVGISMGGLIARALAAGLDGQPPLHIRRLFTLATPHRGAVLADWVRLDPACHDLRQSSPFLQSLDRAAQPIDIRPFALKRDGWVGTARTGPIGTNPYVLPPIGLARLGFSHFAIANDPRIIAAIVVELRSQAGP
jgi:pimeloyl-ACP methyl ester carboxylesterase